MRTGQQRLNRVSVENTKLSTYKHAQSVFGPRQFRLRLVEANKTEPTVVNFWRNKCGIRVEKEHRLHLKPDCVCFSGKYSIIYIPLVFSVLNKMGISNNKNCAFGCNQTDYPEKIIFFSCKKISTIWEYVEEKV